MISSETFHVVTTELVVGAYSVSGFCFTLCFLIHFGLLKRTEWMSMFDNVAHFTLVFGLAATPFAILSGVSSSPGEGLSSPLLVNKMFLSMAGAGFAIGTALSRWRLGKGLWDSVTATRIHCATGLAACGSMLLTASVGGTFTRGESLLDVFQLPYEQVLLFPFALSIIALILGIAMVAIGMKRLNTPSSIH